MDGALAIDGLPPELLEAMFANPDLATIELDRELVRQGGLRAFAELAWHTVEADGSFRGGWHIDAICEHLEAVSRGEIRRLAIAVPPRSMKPVAASEPVMVQSRGRVPLGSVQVGDRVLTHRGRYREVLAVHDNGVLPVVKIRTWSGRAAVMAPDHPVLTARGWIAAGDLTTADVVAIPTPIENGGADVMSDEEARLLGYLVGDGSCIYRQLQVVNAEPAVLCDVQACVQAIGFHARLKKTAGARPSKAQVVNIHPTKERWRNMREVNPLRLWRERHGLMGASSRTKRVPPEIMGGSDRVVAQFLGAYWDCDGLIANRGTRADGEMREDVEVSATTVSRGLAEDLLHLLTRLGIRARVRQRSRIVRGEDYIYWMVVLTARDDVAKFRRLVPMRHPKQHNTRMERSDFDRPLTPDPVISIEPAGEAHCICLSVDEDRSFTASDIAVHNSLLVSAMWPAWDWLTRPDRRFLFSSYAQALAIRDAVKSRRIIQSPWYQARWGDRFKLTSDENAKERYSNDRHGYRIATSVGGRTTGEGGDAVVIDDPHNAIEAESEAVREGTLRWWDEAMSTRLNDAKTGAYVIIQQRLNQRDLIGHVLAKKGSEPYTYLCLPALFEPDHPHRWFRDPRKEAGEPLWPEHMPLKIIEERRAALGDYAFAGQMQQRPAPREGGLFKRSWFSIIPAAPGDVTWIRAWDLAATEDKATKSDPDYTATVKLGFSPSLMKFVIGHAFRMREDPHAVRQAIKQFADLDGRMIRQVVPQDPGQAGKDQAKQMALMLAGWPVLIEIPSGDKWTRAQGLAAQAAAGNVVLVKGEWNEDFLTELTGFPTGAHDDWVDAASSAFNRLGGGNTGMLDWMAQQLAAKQRAEAESERPAKDLKEKGWVAVHADTTDQGLSATQIALMMNRRE